MDNFTYCAPTRYIFGADTEKETGREMAAIGCKKVLVVSGGSSARKSGLLDRVLATLEENAIEYEELTGIKPNPTDDRVYEGISQCRRMKADGLLAIGGGSVIDTAKAIAAGVEYEGDFWDFFSGVASVGKALPIGVVLTIPAAGSEGSGNAVITKVETLKKVSIRTDYALRPKFAILNPELTFTLPPYQTAAGVADMMAHIMERYFSPTQEVETTDRISEGLLQAIIEEAPKVIANPEDYQARANIMWAGTLAHNGVCGCGRKEDWTSHGLEHELSALYGVTHGAGLAVVFPAWMTFMASHRPERVVQLGRKVFHIETPDMKAAALETVDCLRAFFKSIGLPVTLGELGVENADIPELTRRFHETKGLPFGSYYPIYEVDTAAIYSLMK